MATAAQIAANQLNAQHSTGPRTEHGKHHSSHNRQSHGLSSKEFILLAGELDFFDSYMADLCEAIQPAGALEFDLFTQLAHASWTLRRFRRAEAQIQVESLHPDLDPALVPESEVRLQSLQIYAQRAERSYHRALKELRSLQSVRALKASSQYVAVLCEAAVDDAAPLSDPLKAVATRIEVDKLRIAAARAEGMRLAVASIEPPHSHYVRQFAPKAANASAPDAPLDPLDEFANVPPFLRAAAR